MKDITSVQACQETVNRVIETVGTVIIGKEHIIRLTFAAFLAQGHVLFEDIPGTGKTMLVKTLAAISGGSFKRIQFTADLLPSDILGISIYHNHTHEFEFKPGPIFADMVLADEINRTTPRTQSALLEAMSEQQITIDGHTHDLGEHFFVIATQNPTDYQGTYPLPEAQLDRFMLRLSLGYPNFKEELELLKGVDRERVLAGIEEVVTQDDITKLKGFVDQVMIEEHLMDYALKLVYETRNHKKIKLGISPRGSLNFIQVAKAYALSQGRLYCTPDDFKTLIEPVFAHRLLLHSNYQKDPKAVKEILDEICRTVKVPLGLK